MIRNVHPTDKKDDECMKIHFKGDETITPYPMSFVNLILSEHSQPYKVVAGKYDKVLSIRNCEDVEVHLTPNIERLYCDSSTITTILPNGIKTVIAGHNSNIVNLKEFINKEDTNIQFTNVEDALTEYQERLIVCRPCGMLLDGNEIHVCSSRSTKP